MVAGLIVSVGGFAVKTVTAKQKVTQEQIQRLIRHVNRKDWWHVPPADPHAYERRGKFFASSFREAEFYGRPLDNPERVVITKPLIGNEHEIANVLGVPGQREGMGLEEIAEHDALWRNAAIKRGFDCIILMTAKAFLEFQTSGKIPRSLELNVVDLRCLGAAKSPLCKY